MLPGIFKFARKLTPLAAAGLGVIMVGAVALSVGTSAAGAATPFVIGVLCVVVAVGRRT